jgi:hypothetical protein
MNHLGTIAQRVVVIAAIVEFWEGFLEELQV